MANELVEKVAKALDLMDGNISMQGEQAMARRAIKAVLAHLAEPGNVSRDMGLVAMERHNTVGGDWRHTIAAAMSAALKELKEDKTP